MAKKFKGLTLEIEGNTKPLQDSLKGVSREVSDVSTELRQVERLLQMDPGNTEALRQQQELLEKAVAGTSDKLKLLENSARGANAQLERGEISEATFRELQREIIKTEQELKSYQNRADKAGTSTKSFGDKLGGLKTGFSVVGGALAAGGAVVGGILAFTDANKEAIESAAKLETAFETSGLGAENAASAYVDFYGILGDEGQATEAAQLLTKIATSQEDISKWTNISTGIVAEFGDSLPIESLIEAANETAKVGTVTGTLADALNWVGESEDEFNAKLAATNSEQERAQLITDTLNGLYDESASLYRENAAATIEANEAQATYEQTLASLAERLTPLATSFKTFATETITNLVDAYENGGAEGVGAAVSTMVQSGITKITDSAPEFLAKGLEMGLELAKGLPEAIPDIIEFIPEAIFSIGEALWENREDILQLGVDIAKGIVEGLWNSISYVGEQVSGFFNSILGGAKDDIESNSPSKLWARELGKPMGQGVSVGFEDEVPNVSRSLSSSMKTLTDNASYATSSPSVAVSGGMGSSDAFLVEVSEVISKGLFAGLTAIDTRIQDLLIAILTQVVKVNMNGRTVAELIFGDIEAIAAAKGKQFWSRDEIVQLILRYVPVSSS